MDTERVKQVENFLTAHGITRRAAWGAQPAKIDDSKADNLDWDYNTLVIHHSGRSGETDPVAIQAKHMQKNGWSDVGYHFMIGPGGQIYEGRSLVFKGAHVENANTGKIGILVMGNFERELWGLLGREPRKQQLDSAINLGNWLKQLFPLIKTLGGHRDFKVKTECPGSYMYAHLDELRRGTGLLAP